MENRMIEYYRRLTVEKTAPPSPQQELGPVTFAKEILDAIRASVARCIPSIPSVDRGPACRKRHGSCARTPDYKNLQVKGKGMGDVSRKVSLERKSSPVRQVYRWPPAESKQHRSGDGGLSSIKIVGRRLMEAEPRRGRWEEEGEEDEEERRRRRLTVRKGATVPNLPLRARQKASFSSTSKLRTQLRVQ